MGVRAPAIKVTPNIGCIANSTNAITVPPAKILNNVKLARLNIKCLTKGTHKKAKHKATAIMIP